MRLKHSCRSNTNNLGGGCDRRFRCHFLAHAGLLFSHLPSNDLDAILTACTARRTSSISQWWREGEGEGDGVRGRQEQVEFEGGRWYCDPSSDHWLLLNKHPAEQRRHVLLLLRLRLLLFFIYINISFDCYGNDMQCHNPPPPSPQKTKTKTKHPNISHPIRPVAKELQRGPDRLTDRCWCAKNSSAKQNSTHAKVSIDLSATLHVIKLTPK